MKKYKIVALIGSILLFTLVIILFYHVGQSKAAFNASDLMDNSIFDNVNTMNTTSINNFLNSFPNSCISPNNQFLAPDPTGYSPSTGFTYGSNVTAGQVINDAAQAYGINPEVLITILEKEQSLVTGNNGCSVLNYVGAMGYGCPDGGSQYNYSGIDLYTLNGAEVTSVSGTCVSSYLQAGFSQQVIHAAWLLKFGEQRSEGNVGWAVIKGNWNNSDDPPTCYYGPMTAGSRAMSDSSNPCSYTSSGSPIPGNQPLVYSGYTTIDGTSVQMQSGATAALYWYTPHFAGNENFDSIFQSWFGPTTNGDSYFEVINTNPDNGSNMWYLLTPEGKYYIPTMAVYDAWGLNNYAFQSVSQTYFDSLPTGPNLGNMLKDEWGNYFLVENGQTHYIPNSSYMSLWNLSPTDAAQSTGLVFSLPAGNWLGRFVVNASSPSSMYLMNAGTLLPVPTTTLEYEWGYVSNQLTSLGSTYFNTLPVGSDVTQFVTDGTNDYIVDTDSLLAIPNSDTLNAYGTQTYMDINSITLSLLNQKAATVFVSDSSGKYWYMLSSGQKYYIPTISLAQDWGFNSSTNGLTVISDSLLNSYPNQGNLTYIAERSSDNSLWLLDGNKHLISAGTTAQAWIPANTTPTIYSAQSLDLLPTGSNVSTLIQGSGSSYVYTMDNGQKRFLLSQAAQNAWGASTFGITSLNNNLVTNIPEAGPVSYMVQNSGNYYMLMNGVAYEVNQTYDYSWAANWQTPTIASSTLARFTISNQVLGPYVQINGTNYIMEALVAIPVTTYLDAYNFTSSNTVTLPNNYFYISNQASYLVQANNRIWLISNGQKYWLDSFPIAASYGFISQNVPVTQLDPAVINQIPTNTSVPSLLITTPNQGIKLLNFGRALAFPNGTTLNNYYSTTNYVFNVSPSIYNAFILYGETSSLILDDSGKVYSVSNGQRDWITNPSLLTTTYSGIPITYLDGTTMAIIPEGQPIN